MRRFGVRLSIPLLVAIFPPAFASAAGCGDDPGYKVLDFWVGEWVVREKDAVAGTNRIEKILRGCALMEHWRDAGGREGESLFYRDVATGSWKQVWVTDSGAVKEKRLILRGANDGSVRFQGEVTQPDGTRVLDRTTLTPLPGARVRQRIEISDDLGRTWRPVFDAVYERNTSRSSGTP